MTVGERGVTLGGTRPAGAARPAANQVPVQRWLEDLYARWGSPLLAGVAMLGILVVLGGLFGGQIAVAVFALAVTTLGVAFARVSVDLARSSSEELQRVRKEAETSLQELQRAREALERMSPPPADEG